jgi:hypothetical protein
LRQKSSAGGVADLLGSASWKRKEIVAEPGLRRVPRNVWFIDEERSLFGPLKVIVREDKSAEDFACSC